MNWFKNLKTNKKLILCFIVVALLTGIVGLLGITNMNTINTNSGHMYNREFLPSLDLASIQTALEDVRANHLLAVYERDPNLLQTRLSQIETLVTRSNSILSNYSESIDNPDEQTLYNNVMNSLIAYREVRDKNLELIKQQRYDQALLELNKVTEARLSADAELKKIIEYKANESALALKNSESSFRTSSIIMIIVILVSVVLAIVLGLFVARLISNPLNKLVEVANSIADNDLDVNIEINTNDEIGMLSRAISTMVDNLNKAMGDINTASEQVAVGAKQVSDTSIALSEGATEQASSIEQLTASIQEISSQTELNAENAQQANHLAEDAKLNAVEGNNKMRDMLNAMQEINESSANISKIIKVIDDIAFQTNILALNAAVEAARAGQHGKGFAVVAEEVRNLAARSANAARETTDMIEGSIKKTEGGTIMAKETAASLNIIVDNVEKVANLVNNIAVASSEQATGIEQINQGILQVSDVVQNNSATSEESAAASEELSSQAVLLKETVGKFKLKQSNNSYAGLGELNPDVLRMLEGMNKNTNSNLKKEFKDEKLTNKRITLSDKEFGKY